MIKRGSQCVNLNHSRTNVPVRYCPTCGEVVNGSLSNVPCNDEKHAGSRRRGSAYCMDCGKRLTMTT